MTDDNRPTLDYQRRNASRRVPRYGVVTKATWIAAAAGVLLNLLILALGARAHASHDGWLELGICLILTPAANVLFAIISAAIAPALRHWSGGVPVLSYVRVCIVLPLAWIVVVIFLMVMMH